MRAVFLSVLALCLVTHASHAGDCFGCGTGGASYIMSGPLGIGTMSPGVKLTVTNAGGATPAAYIAQISQTASNGAGTDSNALVNFYHYNGSNSRSWMMGTGSNTLFGYPDNFGFYDVYASTPVLVLQAGGNVGIGTTAPSSPQGWGPSLVVSGGVPVLYLSSTATNAGEWGIWSGNGGTSGKEILGIVDSTASATRMIIDSNGYVGVGTTGPNYTLHVNGTAYATGAAGALSDIRHKKNVMPLTAGLKEVERLRPVTFEWKQPTDRGMKGRQIGFIAQDVEKVLPSVVMTEDNEEKTKNMKYNEIIPVLARAIQELKTDNDDLRAAFDAYRQSHP